MADVALGVERRKGESWCSVVSRYSRPQGLEHECLTAFKANLESGMQPCHACFGALSDWDCLDLWIDGEKYECEIASKSNS